MDWVAREYVSLRVCALEKEGGTGVACLGVDICLTLFDLEIRLRGYSVESIFTAGEDFAGIAVAGKRGLFVGGLPLKEAFRPGSNLMIRLPV